MQPLVQEFPQRVFGIFEEQTVVAQGRHGNGDLSQVVEILQHRTLQKNHQTQVTRAREGRVGRVRVDREEGRGKASSVEGRGLSSVCASPQPRPSSPKPGHPISPPLTRPQHSPHSYITCPSLPGSAHLPAVGNAPSCLQSRSIAQGSCMPQLTPTCMLSSPPRALTSSACPTSWFCCFDCKHSG